MRENPGCRRPARCVVKRVYVTHFTSLFFTLQPATYLLRPGLPATTSSTVLHHASAFRCLPQHPTAPTSTTVWHHLILPPPPMTTGTTRGPTSGPVPATTSSTVLHHAPASWCLPRHPMAPTSTKIRRHLNWSRRAHTPMSFMPGEQFHISCCFTRPNAPTPRSGPVLVDRILTMSEVNTIFLKSLIESAASNH